MTINPQDPLILAESLIALGRSADGTVERDLLAAIQRLQQQHDDLLAAAQQFVAWARPTARDWENGAVRDEFDMLKNRTRAAIAKATESTS